MSIEIFFKTINDLIHTGVISNEWYLIQYTDEVNVHHKENEPSKNIYFGNYQKLLFINFNHAYRSYRKLQFDNGNEYLQQNELLQMIKKHDAYVGSMKAKKIYNHIRRCIVFKAYILK